MSTHSSEATAADRQHLIVRVFKDIEWQYEALCHGRMHWFFPDRNSDNRNHHLLPIERKAKALCARCPVRRECLKYGLEDEYGIWGGTLPSERRIGGARSTRIRTDIDIMLDEMSEQAARLGLVDREAVA